MIRPIALSILTLMLIAAPPAAQQAEAQVVTKVEDLDEVGRLIWQKELDIYANREMGNMQFYVDQTAENYLGWPPQYAEPLSLQKLDETRAGVQGVSGEKLELFFGGFTRQGDTALIFYSTHRTARAGGIPSDEWFETIHVFIKGETEQDWQLLGGLARPRPENREAIGNQMPPVDATED